MMYHSYLDDLMRENPEFKNEYLMWQPEFEVIRMILDSNLTNKEIHQKSGLSIRKIKKIRIGECDLKLSELKCLAEAIGYYLCIKFRKEA